MTQVMDDHESDSQKDLDDFLLGDQKSKSGTMSEEVKSVPTSKHSNIAKFNKRKSTRLVSAIDD